MHQSNALRRLEVILYESVTSGSRGSSASAVLMNTMGVDDTPRNVIDFFELLNKALSEAETLKNISRIERYLRRLDQLFDLFVSNHLSLSWATFSDPIDDKGVLEALDALANYYHAQNPLVLANESFLESLSQELSSVLNEVLSSDVSTSLKRLLSLHLENMLRAIRRYRLEGTEGLRDAAQSAIGEFSAIQSKISNPDKENFAYKRALS